MLTVLCVYHAPMLAPLPLLATRVADSRQLLARLEVDRGLVTLLLIISPGSLSFFFLFAFIPSFPGTAPENVSDINSDR